MTHHLEIWNLQIIFSFFNYLCRLPASIVIGETTSTGVFYLFLHVGLLKRQRFTGFHSMSLLLECTYILSKPYERKFHMRLPTILEQIFSKSSFSLPKLFWNMLFRLLRMNQFSCRCYVNAVMTGSYCQVGGILVNQRGTRKPLEIETQVFYTIIIL